MLSRMFNKDKCIWLYIVSLTNFYFPYSLLSTKVVFDTEASERVFSYWESHIFVEPL